MANTGPDKATRELVLVGAAAGADASQIPRIESKAFNCDAEGVIRSVSTVGSDVRINVLLPHACALSILAVTSVAADAAPDVTDAYAADSEAEEQASAHVAAALTRSDRGGTWSASAATGGRGASGATTSLPFGASTGLP